MSVTKVCPECGTEYPADTRFCELDGTALRSVHSATDLIGTVVAERYHVLKKLGEGGMGQVYLAEHVKIGRKTALRVMHASMFKDVDAISRFNREAANASRISHPNVAAVFEFGETPDGLIFLAMEFVDGPPLTKVIEQSGWLPAKRSAEIIRQAGEALALAHDMGIVHRDLKPDNIMIAKTRDGGDLVKVVEFGIARAAGNDAQKMTKTGLVVGTPEYMSPEQLAGEQLDGRSDIYSLGLVAFNMLTGRLPFPSASAQESMILRLTHKPKTLAEMRPDLAWPGDVQQVMAKALEREVSQRYQTATEFGRDLFRAIDRTSQTKAAELGTQMLDVPPTRAAPRGPPETPQTSVGARVAGPLPAAGAAVGVPAPARPAAVVPQQAAPPLGIRRAVGRLVDGAAVVLDASGRAMRQAPSSNSKAQTFSVWYATNRRPIAEGSRITSYSAERDSVVHYGRCDVVVPKAHRIGSLGTPLWKRLLEFRWADDHLRVTRVARQTEAEHWAQIGKRLSGLPDADRQAVIFLHGYNVSFEGAALRSAQIGVDLNLAGPMAFFSWPSKGTPAGYPADEATIDACENHIADYLAEFARSSGARRVNVIAHSMGNRGLLRAIQRLISRAASNASGVQFGHFILAAPDVDRDLFLQLSRAYGQAAQQTTLYVSDRDRALDLSRWLHHYPRVGYSPPVTVVPGIDTVYVGNVDLTILGHGYVAEAAEVLRDMHELLQHDATPDKRFALRRMTDAAEGPYWSIRT